MCKYIDIMAAAETPELVLEPPQFDSETKKKTYMAFHGDLNHHSTLWWHPGMTLTEAYAAFNDVYGKLRALAKQEAIHGVQSMKYFGGTLSIRLDTESRLGSDWRTRAFEPTIYQSDVGLSPFLCVLREANAKYDGGSYQGDLRVHVTLVEGDEPERLVGTTMTASHLGIHWGKLNFMASLAHAGGRVPRLALPYHEQRLWDKCHNKSE